MDSHLLQLTIMPCLEILEIGHNKIKRLPTQPGYLVNLQVGVQHLSSALFPFNSTLPIGSLSAQEQIDAPASIHLAVHSHVLSEGGSEPS